MTVTKHMWDPDFDTVMKEEDGLGVTTAEYNYEPVQYGRLISQNRDGETSYYHYDGLGSTNALTDTNGDVTDTYEYDAWGNATATTGSKVNPYRWVGEPGYYFDAETGLFYIRARTYQPTVARWMSVDPVGFIDGTNFFLYVRNNPVNHLDANGLQEWKQTLDCQSSDPNACYCDFGTCKFTIDFSQGDNDFRLCFSHTPDEPENEVPQPGSQTCHAWTTRTQITDDHVTGTPRVGEPCKFTINNFPPNSPMPIWNLLPTHCRPPNVRFVAPCLIFSEYFRQVTVKFTIAIACGCAIGRNESTIEVESTLPPP